LETANNVQRASGEARHTPGPWKVIYSPKLQVCDVAETWTITDLDWDYLADGVPAEDAACMDAVDEANARLIASAPSLLAACERLVAIVEALPSPTWGQLLNSGRFSEACDALGLNEWAVNEGRADQNDTIHINADFARSAVSKAKGGAA